MPLDSALAAAAPAGPSAGARIVKSEFSPPPWLHSAHLQTLWPVFFRPFPRPRLSRERMELTDGDFLDIDWAAGDGNRVALILHGLEGSSQSHYARGMLSALTLRGWRAGVMHFRGCSGLLNRLARNYHSGDTADLDFVVNRLRRRWPHAPLVAIGYSLGGNVLLKWLAEQGTSAPVSASVAVSVPFQLDHVATRLSSGGSRFYQWRLLAGLRQKMRRKHRSRPFPVSLKEINEGTDFFRFDDRVTAPLHGFPDADTYYREASCGPRLRHIGRPTLIIHALDDPFMWPEVVPDEGDLSEHVRLELSQVGGHVGFVSGSSPIRPRYWLEERIPRFLEEVTCDA